MQNSLNKKIERSYMKSTSIIIPTYNRPKTLHRVFNTYFQEPFVSKIIVIDDHSEVSYDEFKDYARKICCYNNVEFEYKRLNKRVGAAAARNIGLSYAKTKFIMWGEDDVYLDKNYLLELIKVLAAKNKRTVVFGSIIYNSSSGKDNMKNKKSIRKQRKLIDYARLKGNFDKVYLGVVETLFGHALIMTYKEAYNLVSYYEHYRDNGFREETDGQIQLLKKGYRFLYVSYARCFHLPRKEIEKGGQHNINFLKYEIAKIRNNRIFLKRHYKFLKLNYCSIPPKVVIEVTFVKDFVISILKQIIKKVIKFIGTGV